MEGVSAPVVMTGARYFFGGVDRIVAIALICAEYAVAPPVVRMRFPPCVGG